jgi:predicted  nucleic acid-binding Zn-ribbon protein
MSATQIAATLFQLQQLDLDIERIQAEQQAVVKALQDSPGLQKLRAEYSLARQRLQASVQAQKEAEWSLEELNRRLDAQAQRLYSGVVTHPKELHALQQEMQHLRASQSRQEDKVLEAIADAENQQEQVQRRAEALRAAEETRARESATSAARRDQLEGRQQELQARRAQLVTGVNADYVKRYESMRRTKQGRAVSKVEQNSCQWCRVILTPSELQHIRVSSDLQTCTNCGRILYYDR